MKNNLIILITIIFSVIFAQNTELNVTKITVLGNVEMEEENIINFSGLSINSTINAIDIQNCINRLWLLNKFEDIQIDIEDNNRYKNLIIKVIEYPIIDRIDFNGDYFKFKLFKFKKSKSKLKEMMKLNKGEILSSQKIKEAIFFLKEDFFEKGYHDIEIIYNSENSSIINHKNITFTINPGDKTKIKNISIFINNKKLDSKKRMESLNNFFKSSDIINKRNIIKNLGEIKVWKWYNPWKGSYSQEKLDLMQETLSSYYKSIGYLDFSVNNYEINSKNNELILDISLGEIYYINDISFIGNYIFNDSTINAILDITPGTSFNGYLFEMSNMNLTTLYRDKGYLFSEIIPSFIPITNDSLNIIFSFNENSIVKVNQIIIKGNNSTEENVIRRDISIFPGQTFSQSSLVESARKLFMLNYFDNVIPDVKRINNTEVDLVFEVVEKSSGQLNFSAGYSGLSGFTGGGGFSFPNFLGKGQNVSVNYQRGISSNNQSSSTLVNPSSQEVESNQQFSFSFIEPRLFDTSNLVGISMNYTERGQSSTYSMPFDSKSYGGGLRLGRRFNWPDKFFKGTWMINTSIREYYSVNESDLLSYYSTGIQDYITYNGDKYIFSTSGVNIKQQINRDNRDHPEFPTSGSHFNWTFTFSGDFLGGDEDYYKNEFGLKWYNKIIEKFVLHQNFKAGILNPIKGNSGRSIVPPSARFLMGGVGIPYGEMLRGYSDNMIGPLGSSFPKGGNVMLKYSLELRYLISASPNMYILAFADAGNVWDNINLVDPFSLRRSLGVGARVMMPMLGMLGYDIGYGFDSSVQEHLNGNNNAHGWEYHFIFGMPIY